MSENRKNFMAPVIGEIYMMKFEGEGNVQNGWRPGVVFQINVGNIYSPNIIALTVTCSIKKLNQPTHVVLKSEESGLERDGMVLCENPTTISKNQIGRYLAKLSDKIMQKIAYASILATASASFLDDEDLIEARRIAIHLNEISSE